MTNYHRGRFTPVNKEKYKGDINNIIYRSSWELQFLKYLDRHQDVLAYSSEELYIHYIYPFSKKGHKIRKYYPDFLVKIINKQKKIETWLIEIKPLKETIPPKSGKTKKKTRLIREQAVYQINRAKWAAAEQFCKKHNIKFIIMTEKHLGNIINGH